MQIDQNTWALIIRYNCYNAELALEAPQFFTIGLYYMRITNFNGYNCFTIIGKADRNICRGSVTEYVLYLKCHRICYNENVREYTNLLI